MSKAATILRTTHSQPNYLRVDATDGMTYAAVRDVFPKKRSVMIYETWATDSRDVGVALSFGRLPKHIRTTVRAHFSMEG